MRKDYKENTTHHLICFHCVDLFCRSACCFLSIMFLVRGASRVTVLDTFRNEMLTQSLAAQSKYTVKKKKKKSYHFGISCQIQEKFLFLSLRRFGLLGHRLVGLEINPLLLLSAVLTAKSFIASKLVLCRTSQFLLFGFLWPHIWSFSQLHFFTLSHKTKQQQQHHSQEQQETPYLYVINLFPHFPQISRRKKYGKSI